MAYMVVAQVCMVYEGINPVHQVAELLNAETRRMQTLRYATSVWACVDMRMDMCTDMCMDMCT